jgi:hypothetical protein
MRQSNHLHHPQSILTTRHQTLSSPHIKSTWNTMHGTALPKNSPSWRLLVGQPHSSRLFQGRKRSRFHCRHHHSIPLDARLCILVFWLETGPPPERTVAVDHPFLPDDVLWDYSKLRFYSFFTIWAGAVAGLIGIGGGMVLGPLMLVQWVSIIESRQTLPLP